MGGQLDKRTLHWQPATCYIFSCSLLSVIWRMKYYYYYYCIFLRSAFSFTIRYTVAVWRSSMNRRMSVCLCFTGMAQDYLPRISSENCHYPFTYNGTLYHGCAENIENVTAPCERWGCFQVNYSAAVCAANIGKGPKTTNSAVADKPRDAFCAMGSGVAVPLKHAHLHGTT